MSHSEISDITAPRSQFYHGPYGRMFRNLPPHVPTLDLLERFDGQFSENDIAQIDPDTDEGREAILKLLARTMIEPELQSDDDDNSGNNPDIPAGYTYFGQFITHDITFDPTSSLMRFNDPNKLRNFRTPRLDLDSLYGGGPEDNPYLYDQNTYGKLLVGKGTRAIRHRDNAIPPSKEIFRLEELDLNDRISVIRDEEDLPRNSQGWAIIGDPRNDENIIISQLQLAFIKFHNLVMDCITHSGLEGKQAFHKARRLVQWHYQWVILHDFLPKIVGSETIKEIGDAMDCLGQPKLCFYEWQLQPFIPVEFSVAAFRFGHSMIRAKYDLNNEVKEKTIIECTGPGNHNLMGNRPLTTHWTIDWVRFFDIDGSDYQESRQIDAKLSFPLGRIPSHLGNQRCHNLAELDLLRGYRMGLPSGQAVAKAMGIQKGDILEGPEAPLWYYILREAETQQDKRQQHKEVKETEGQLGPVGTSIVAEVIIGLLAGDPHSFLNVDPWWYPNYLQNKPAKLKNRTNPLILEGQKNPFTLSQLVQLAAASITN